MAAAMQSRLHYGDTLDLLLIGKTGNGKSATGNSILGRKGFKCSLGSESKTANTSSEWTEFNGRLIKVVDVPGVCDTRWKLWGGLDHVFKCVSRAITHCSHGFHALLLVININSRMTREEKNAVAYLKMLLGADIIRNYVVCVLTFGDNFESYMEDADEPLTFEQWIHEQKGGLGELFNECQHRCVLFNNKERNPEKKKAQLIKLINMVDNLNNVQGKRYTNELFELAKMEFKRIVEEQKKAISEEITCKAQQFLQVLTVISKDAFDGKRNAVYIEKAQLFIRSLKEKVDDMEPSSDKAEKRELLNLMRESIEVIDKDEPDPSEVTKMHNDLAEKIKTNISEEYQQILNEAAEKVQQALSLKETKNACFPGSSVAYLKDGTKIALRDLQIGQEVLVRDVNDTLTYGTVYMFGLRDPDVFAEFVVLETEQGEASLTKEHFLYCFRNGKELCLTAEQVLVGDELLCLVDPEPSTLKASPVMKKRLESKLGFFAPYTMTGTVVVDDTLMSCYTNRVSHNTAHTLLWPLRQIYKWSPPALALVTAVRDLKMPKLDFSRLF